MEKVQSTVMCRLGWKRGTFCSVMYMYSVILFALKETI